MQGYSVKIVETSKELTPKEKVALKNFDNMIQLDEEVHDDSKSLRLQIEDYAVIEVYNEKSDNKNYTKYIFIDNDNRKYITGSQPLFDTFMEIYEEMKDEEEPWEIDIYKRKSKNYNGKYFLSCSIVD